MLVSARMPAGSSFYGKVVGFTTGAPLGPTPGPRFKNNSASTGTPDDVTRPTAATVSLTQVSGGRVLVTASSSDAGSQVSTFEVWTKDGAAPATRLTAGVPTRTRSGKTATKQIAFAGESLHTYEVQVRARDAAGNVGPWGFARITVL